jgi:putative oxidoreductase
MSSRSKPVTIALWVVTAILALLFALAGTTKLLGQAEANFIHWGYPPWFAYLIGIGEVGGAILILIPRTATLAGAGMAAIMAGATFTHVRSSEWPHVPLTIGVLLLAVAVAWLRRSDFFLARKA